MKTSRILSFTPKLQSINDYLITVELNYGTLLNNTDQVGIWKFDSDFCPMKYNEMPFRVLSVGHSKNRLRYFTRSL